MGITGLTKFMADHEQDFMVNYELGNTKAVLSGSAVCRELYFKLSNRNDALGGDYDRYGEVVYDFFNTLSSCNITPYVLFDGGYNSTKIPEMNARMRSRSELMKDLEQMRDNSGNQVFPLHIRTVFHEIVRKLNIKMVNCTFDSDLECASIAKALNCPLLGNDSDFYMYDIMYIPLKTLELDPYSRGASKYLACKAFRMDELLNYYKGLDKSKLPLLAILLGCRERGFNHRHSLFYVRYPVSRVERSIAWLQRQSLDSAIQAIISNIRNEKVKNDIGLSYKTYTLYPSVYLKYLGIAAGSDLKVSNTIIEKYYKPDPRENDNVIEKIVSKQFLESFKNGLYPSHLIDLITKNEYFCYPQVDDFALEPSYKPSLEIISAIYKILCKDGAALLFHGRTKVDIYGKFREPSFVEPLPTFAEIEDMNVRSKQKVVTKVLHFDESILNMLESNLPRSWDLFVLCLKYSESKSRAPAGLLEALVLCKIVLEHVTEKVGFRHSKTKLNWRATGDNEETTLSNNIIKNLSSIPLGECQRCLDSCMTFFVSETRVIHDKTLIHYMSQFQACLLHGSYLNEVLGNPFDALYMPKCLNSTFVYRLTKYLQGSSNLNQQLKSLLKNSPTIYHTMTIIVKKIKELQVK